MYEYELNIPEPEELIAAARSLVAAGRYVPAYEMYLQIAENDPQMRSVIEGELRLVLERLNVLLAGAGNYVDIFCNYERAVMLYPDNMYLLNGIGQHLFKFGHHKEALNHFQEALTMDSGFVAAEKNINNTKNFFVERWHFRMLNDMVRNDAYRRAISSSMEGGQDTILDLGSGTAILTIYANESRPVASTAVEVNKTMVEMAHKVLYSNNISGTSIVHNLSTSLNYKDIGGKRSLLITEMFDAGLLGEHILPTLSHAWEHLLNVNARTIPGWAEYFIVGAKCDCLHQKYQLSNLIKQYIIMGNKNIHVNSSDTYDCEDIHLVKDIKYMTEPESLFKINFSDYDDIQAALHRTDPYNVMLRAKEDGEINLIFGWFNLHLTDDIVITTNPTSANRSNAWQQAIFFDFIPTTVQANDLVPLQFSTHKDKLKLVLDESIRIRRIQPEVVRFLNDAKYMDLIGQSTGRIYQRLAECTDISQVKVVDLCPFPMLGLRIMQRGIKSLTCRAINHNDAAFIKRVFAANNIPATDLNILVGGDISPERFADDKYHMILTNIVDLSGDINPDTIQLQRYLSRRHLAPGGLALPHRVSLQAQVVRSPWLEAANRLDDANVHGYIVAPFLNRYQVSQNIHLDLSRVPHEALTAPLDLGVVTDWARGRVLEEPVTAAGEASAVLCWYTIELIEGGGEVSTRESGSFADGAAFLADPTVPLAPARPCHVILCVDPDGTYKIVLDSD